MHYNVRLLNLIFRKLSQRTYNILMIFILIFLYDLSKIIMSLQNTCDNQILI